MAPEFLKKHILMKYSTLAGCFLILLPNGIPWIWGNISIYTSSYLRMKHNKDATVLSAWTTSLFMLFWVVPAFTVAILKERMGKRGIMCIGIVINETGHLLGWLGLLYPQIPLELGFGVFCGLGVSFIYTINYLVIIELTTKHTCLATAFIQNGLACGSLAVNQIITQCINPANEKPFNSPHSLPYFGQADIIERVPRFFQWFTITSCAISLLSVLMIRTPNSQAQQSMECVRNEKESSYVQMEKETTPIKTEKIIYALNAKTESGVCTTPIKTEKINYELNAETESDVCQNAQITTKELLKSKVFYVLWYLVVTTDASYLSVTVYYKPFGLTQIDDDHFLTLAGTTSAIWSFVGGLICGAVMDRFGAKRPYIVTVSLLSIVSVWYSFSPSFGKLIFYFSTQAFVAFSITLYNGISIGIIRIFGRYQYTDKYALVFSITLASALTIAPLLEFLITHIDWFGMYTVIGFLNFIALLLIIFALPDK